MKRTFLNWMMGLSTMILLTACPPDKDDPELKVSPTELTLENGQAQFTITSNTSWNITPSTDWVVCQPLTGNGNQTVTVSAAPSTTQRECVLTVTDADFKRMETVKVVQPAPPVQKQITLNHEELSFDHLGGTQRFSVTSDVEAWTVSCNENWLSVNPEYGSRNNVITVSVIPKEDEGSHEATITVTGEGATATLKVTQSGVSLATEKSELLFSPTGGSETVVITANADWTAASSADWCTVSPAKGSGDDNVTITAKAGSKRTATVTVKSGTVEKTITVSQDEEILTVDKSSISIEQNGSMNDNSIAITSNTSWTITSSEKWCSVDMASGSGNSKFTVSATANTSTDERKATITIKSSTITRSIAVTQAPNDPDPVVTPTELVFESAASSKQFNITYHKSWTISSGQSWCKVNKSEGSGNADITVTTEENTSSSDRSATITVRFGNNAAPIYVSVTQNRPKPFLTATPEDSSFDPDGGSVTISVNSNVNWTVRSSQTWCSVSPASGNNSGTVTLSASANSTGQKRTASVTIEGGGITRTISISQDGVSLTLGTLPTFAADGGTASLSVNSNYAWTVTEKPSWCTISPTSGHGNRSISVTADINTSTSTRSGTIKVKAGEIERKVTIQQDAQIPDRLEVAPESFWFDVNGGEKTVTINSNTNWTVSSNQPWCSVSRTSGSGNGSITVSAPANSSTSQLKATITVKTTSGSVVRYVSVSQDPYTPDQLEVSPSSITLGQNEGSNVTVSVTSNTSWTVSSSQSWCSVSRRSGSNNGSFTVSATSANNGEISRSATITVQNTSGTIVRTVSVTQEGISLSVSPSTLSFNAEGGTRTVNVTCNASWTASSNQSWCTVKTSGSTITVTTSANTGSSDRSATVTVKSGNVSRTVSVVQSKPDAKKPGEDDNPLPQYSRRK